MTDQPSDVDVEHEPYMQPRCVHCKREQYALNVIDVSLGIGGCSWCGRRAPVYHSHAAWRAAYDRPINYGDEGE